MGVTFFFDWEVSLMEWLQSNMGSFGVAVASFCSLFGDSLFTVLIIGFLYWCWDKRKAVRVGIDVMMSVVIYPLVKNAVLRRRPYFDHPGIKCLKPVIADADIYDITAQGFSFPSGHSSSVVASFGGTAYAFRKKWLTAVAVAGILLCGISRFCVGVHYPTDVLCGWMIGIIIVLLMPVVENAFKRRWLLYLVLFALMLPGWFYCDTDDYFTGVGMYIGFACGDLFERRYVNFENTRRIPFLILRLVAGCGLFFALNTLLKLPFSGDFLDSGTFASHLVRLARYAVGLFVLIGLYPLVFRHFEGLFPQKAKKTGPVQPAE